jgi:hypothetical protein
MVNEKLFLRKKKFHFSCKDNHRAFISTDPIVGRGKFYIYNFFLFLIIQNISSCRL